MGFYNFSYFIKNIFYNFRKSLKYLVLLSIIILIFYCLLCNNSVKAAAPEPSSQVITSVANYFENSNYDSFIFYSENDSYRLLMFNNTGFNVYTEWSNQYSKYWIRCTSDNVRNDCYFYSVDSSGNVTYNGVLKFGVGGGCPLADAGSFYYSNVDIYTSSALTELMFEANYNAVSNPFLYQENGLSYLQNNTFSSFVVFPGDISSVVFTLQNITDNWSFLDSPSLSLNLDSSSIYWQNTSKGYCWVIPKNIFNSSVFKQINGQSYRIRLTDSTGYVFNEYQWTFDMSSDVVSDTEQSTQEQINSGIQDINNFLTNDSYNSSDIDMPSINVDSPAITIGDNIYHYFYTLFTTDSPRDFVFGIPFSNSSITIPSNYIETHLPSIIVNLIKMVYWYCIARYIIKDILIMIDNLRQGDFFLKSEEDIKTEVL